MKNFIAQGDLLTVPTDSIAEGTSIVAGRGYLAGSIFGVAATSVEVTDRGQGKSCVLAVTGIYALPKQPSQAWWVGTRVYWDSANARATITAAENTLIGVAMSEVGATAAETVGHVRLNGIAV